MFVPPFGQPVAKLESVDLSQLDAIARCFFSRLPSHLVLGLVGTLGAGKTTFVQRISFAAGVDTEEVTSPTFTLLQTHQGKMRIHHLDAYRVADEDEFLELGVEELFEDENAWTIVEWADRVADIMPRDTLWICLELSEDHDGRSISVYCDRDDILDALQNLPQWDSGSCP